jgi:hypothetical protein
LPAMRRLVHAIVQLLIKKIPGKHHEGF